MSIGAIPPFRWGKSGVFQGEAEIQLSRTEFLGLVFAEGWTNEVARKPSATVRHPNFMVQGRRYSHAQAEHGDG